MDLHEAIMNGAVRGLVDRNHSASPDFAPELLFNDRSRGEKVFCALERELEHCDSFCISAAFVTMGGLEALKPVLRTLQRHQVPGRILSTDYLAFTEPEALDFLDTFDNIEVRLYACGQTEGFHIKGYLFFRGDDQIRLITGSSNLTASALLANREWNTRLVSTPDGSYARQVLSAFEELWDSLNSVSWSAIAKDYRIRHELAHKQKELALHQQPFSPKRWALQPNAMQARFIRSLQHLMDKGAQRALLISATGTGKTYAAAFAARQAMPRRLLFLVHREQIARQARASFETVIGPERTYGLLGGGNREETADFVFSTIQTLSRPENLQSLPPRAFDWIIIDEVHRAAAPSYLRIFSHFRPQLFLGMSATPDRTDGAGIYGLFDYNVAAHISLQEALEEDLLCPFHYFALSGLEVEDADEQDPDAFLRLVSEERIRHILAESRYYGWSGPRLMGLMFVSSVAEAEVLSEKLNEQGLRTLALSGKNSQEEREQAIRRLTGPEGFQALDYLITVDIFNEGVDIPEINQVLLLRPTKSAIVFTQQLGRGLRKSAGKEFVVVLDFIGLYRNNYMIPAALSGSQTGNKDTLRRFVEEGSRLLPGLSTVHFDEVARRRIIRAIDGARMNSAKTLKEGFQLLQDRLGRIPALTDYDAEAMDPLLIFSNGAYPSYPEFLQKILPPSQRVTLPDYSETELQFLRFISCQWASGKRPTELLLLKALKEPGWEAEFDRLLTRYDISLDAAGRRSLTSQFTRTWLAGTGAGAQPKAVFLTDADGRLQPSPQWKQVLGSSAFTEALDDLICFGLGRWKDRYCRQPRDGWLIRNEKYTYAESFRMMDFPKSMVATNVGGYCFEPETGQFPVYINYDKAKDIAATIAYEDHFLSPTRLAALSKSRRTLDSPDICRLKEAGESGLRIPLFVRKNTEDALKEFWYLGLMKPTGHFEETVMKDGKTRAVRIEYELDHPVRPDLYDYFTQT